MNFMKASMTSNNLYTLPAEDLKYMVARAAEDLSALRGGHIFLTGCTSFFGKWLVEALLYANESMALNLRLTILTRDAGRFLTSMPHLRTRTALAVLAGDIQSFDMDGLSFSHAIHGANLSFDGAGDWPARHMEAAVLGTKRLVTAASEAGAQSVLYLSSGAAYRAEASRPAAAPDSIALREVQFDKSDNISEPSVYSITKRFTEVYATGLGESSGVRIPLARCFTFAGPHMPLAGPQALGNFMADAIAGRDIIIKGDGTPIRSYMYGADLVVWLLALMVRGRHGVPYNVGSKEAVSIRETAEAVCRAFPGKKNRVRVLGRAVAGNAPSVYLPDTGRCEQELGLSCPTALERICAKTAEWFVKRT